MGVGAGVDEDVVYRATRAFWEHIDAVRATAFFLRAITPESAFLSVNVPLHPGAIRYYEEAGYTILEALRP